MSDNAQHPAGNVNWSYVSIPLADYEIMCRVLAATVAETVAWQKLAALTGMDDDNADACLLACQERDAAAEVLRLAVLDYMQLHQRIFNALTPEPRP